MKIVAILVSLVHVECVPKYTLYLMVIALIVKFCMQGPRYFHFNTVAWLFVIFFVVDDEAFDLCYIFSL